MAIMVKKKQLTTTNYGSFNDTGLVSNFDDSRLSTKKFANQDHVTIVLALVTSETDTSWVSSLDRDYLL